MLRPLSKYDLLAESQAVVWEKSNKPSGPDVPKWFGYCHAWAASAILENEPKHARRVEREHRKASLQIGDQKGLLAASHANDVSNSWGDRFGDGIGSEDRNDLAPDVLWRLLRMHIKERKVPLVLDIEAGEEVWNYPVYAYRVTRLNDTQVGQRNARLSLWMADNGVSANFVGIRQRVHHYTFSYKEQDGGIAMGSGKWIGQSVNDHPDFAWYPYIVRPENPEIDYPIVTELLGFSPTEPSPGTETNPDGENGQPTGQQGENESAQDSDKSSLYAAMLSPNDLVTLLQNKTSSFEFDTYLADFGKKIYRPGEALQIRGASEQDGYLYIFQIAPDNSLSLLFPVGNDDDNHIRSEEPFQLDGVHTDKPEGTYRLTAIVTEKPIFLSGLDHSTGQQQQDAARQIDQTQASRKSLGEVSFRWNPSLRMVLQDELAKGGQEESPTKEDFIPIDVTALIGPFAQDRIIYSFMQRRMDPAQNQGKPENAEEK